MLMATTLHGSYHHQLHFTYVKEAKKVTVKPIVYYVANLIGQ